MHDATPANKKWQKEIGALWPAAKGSLAKVYKPCIRPRCPACARGDKHPAWLLSFSAQGRRKVMYVPLALVALIRRAIQNGRQLEKLLSRTGPDLIKQYRRTRKIGLKT
jgi:hypothetical protein